MYPKVIRLFFLCVLFSVKALAISFPDSILFKSYAVQHEYKLRTFGDNDNNKSPAEERILQVKALAKWAGEKDDLGLKYGALIFAYAFILEKNLPDSLQAEKALIELLPQLENDRMFELKAEALQGLANYYWAKQKYPQAFENHINAYNIYNKFSAHDFPEKPIFLKDFGGRYYHFKDFANAALYISEGYRARPEVEEGYIFTLLNTLSLCYLNSDKLDSAEYYLKKVYALAVKKDDSVWQGIVSGNMGMLCFKYHKYDEALKWFQQEINSFHGKPSMNVANTYAITAEIYIAKNEKEKALQIALAAYAILTRDSNYRQKYEPCGNIFYGLSKAYAANGNMDKAYKYLDSATAAKEIVSKRQNAHILAGITYKISANERLVEQQQYDRNVRNNAILKYILIGGMVLLVIITILLINRQKLKYAFSQKQLEAEKQHIESELDIATQQLNTLVGSISDKNELIERFTAQMDQLRDHLSDERLNKADEALTHLQKATIITDEEWEQFSQTFDKVHKGFLKRLNDKVRGLSPIETKFMMLSKMKLSTNEVAAALGISAESVRLNRKRLYTKLNLTEGEQSLQTLIDSI